MLRNVLRRGVRKSQNFWNFSVVWYYIERGEMEPESEKRNVMKYANALLLRSRFSTRLWCKTCGKLRSKKT